jgi:hypothetical protein
MQLQLAASGMPKTRAAAGGGAVPPDTYFEIWRQSIEGMVQLYRSEVARRSTRPGWWPLALSAQRLGDSPESALWIRVYSRVPGSERDACFLGHARRMLGECAAGQALPLEGGDLPHTPPPPPHRPASGRPPARTTAAAAAAAPTLLIQRCRWVRLAKGHGLGAEAAYRGDLEFMADAVAGVPSLDARTKEQVDDRSPRQSSLTQASLIQKSLIQSSLIQA